MSEKVTVTGNQEIVVSTPLGDIVVSVKGDPKDPTSYPGVYVDLKGSGLNDVFSKDTVGLAWIEYVHSKNAVQTVVYGDGDKDDYTHVVVHENIIKKEEENHGVCGTE